MSATARLRELARQRPEWAPWLQVVRQAVVELDDASWDTGLPPTPAQGERKPRLAHVALRLDDSAAARLLDRLTAAAAAAGLDSMAGRAERTRPAEASALLVAAINDDEAVLDAHAARRGAAPAPFRALARLLPMPLLHSSARRWSASIAHGWRDGYCPICGAWPAFAETRGIERSRHLRCGRCGAAWPTTVLACAFCGNTDHETLGSLVVDGDAKTFTIDVCRACNCYLKSLTTLQPTPADEILAVDLRSVEFDLAAAARGHRRPPGSGCMLGASLADIR